MKKFLIILSLGFLFACNGNESADSKSTDLDHTDNDDTSAKKPDSTNSKATDTLHKIPGQ